MKISSILGLNSRSVLFTSKYNDRKSKNVANSKLQTAKVLIKNNVSTPKVIAKFKKYEDINNFDWTNLPDKFAIKPSRGLGGGGIIVVKKKLKSGNFLTTSKEVKTIEDFKLHIIDILEGAYSMGSDPDVAFIQEYVGRHKIFRKLSYRGTPDIRIIVFNKIPVMAMLRLPTKDSGGRANLHQGALGLGIDLATGITTKAIQYNRQIVFKPNTLRKLNGIKIPQWNLILETAIRAQIASNLGYCGVDIVIHPDKGPMVIELNAQPGLSIQLANEHGLKKRLERVDEIDVNDENHGLLIAKALFAENFSNKVKVSDESKTISIWENIIIRSNDRKALIPVKVDTGAWRTSIDETLAKRLGLLNSKNVLWTKKVRTATGKEERPVINFAYEMAGIRIKTVASISKRKHMRVPIIIGRKDLTGFSVKPQTKKAALDWVPDMWNGRIKYQK